MSQHVAAQLQVQGSATAAGCTAATQSSLGCRLHSHPMMRARLAIVYASQTGTALEVGERIERLARRRRFDARALSIDALDVSSPAVFHAFDAVVFIIATAGQGEVPDSMRAFWRHILRKDVTLPFMHLKFTVFGLGDSSYANFNVAARRLHQRALDCGAEAFHVRGLGDDQAPLRYETALEPWLAGMWQRLDCLFPLPADAPPLALEALEPPTLRVTVQLRDAAHAASDTVAVHTSYALSSTAPMPIDQWPCFNVPALRSVRVKSNVRITSAEHEQDVRHIELVYEPTVGDELAHEPGDVVAVYAHNPEFETLEFLRSLGVAPDSILYIAPTESEASRSHAHTTLLPPSPVTARDLFTHYLDIFGTPRRFFFEALSHFCAGGDSSESSAAASASGANAARQREKLCELASSEGGDELYRYCTHERRSFVEVLRDFPAVRLPLERLIELVPRIAPRYFSIASSLAQHPRELHLCVAVVNYATPMRRQRHGLCSNFLAARAPGQCVRVCIRRATSFCMPSAEQPMICIGPGTGIAPFRAMVQQRAHQRRAASVSVSVSSLPLTTSAIGATVLVCGNRYRARDFLFGAEFEHSVECGEIQHLLTAFSRDAALSNSADTAASVHSGDPSVSILAPSSKTYVQQRIREHAELLFELIHEHNAVVLVAGNAKQMPMDVRAAFVDVVRTCTQCDEATAALYLKQLERTGRYRVEAW